MGKRTGGVLAGVLAVVVAILGGLFWSNAQKPRSPETGPETASAPVAAVAPSPAEPAAEAAAPASEAAAEAAAEPAAEPAATPEPEPAATAAPDAAPEAAPAADLAQTRFDLFRAAPDGGLVVAGTAEPEALVELLVDGTKIGEARASARGEYTALLEAGASAGVRLLTLRVTGADGVAREGAESLVIEAGEATGKVLVAGAEGARVLAEAADTLVIDTLAGLTGPAGAPQVISGRGAPAGAVLRAYLDNAEAGLAAPGPDGSWQITLPAFGPGVHLLRVDALDAAGKVIARAETEVEGAAPEPAAPDLAAQSAMAEDRAAARAEAVAKGLHGVMGAGSDRPVAAEAPEVSAAPAPEAASAAEPAASATVAAPAPTTPAAPRRVTVTRGGTLWAIARETYGDGFLYVRVFEANRDQIRNPDLIYPGQVFTLPQ
ncbi:MAG: LysM peptidoglycan-binding domain-containing protein [Paracoccaceae bacterium]